MTPNCYRCDRTSKVRFAAVHESGSVKVFGCRPPERVDGLVLPASENLHRTGIMQRSKTLFASQTSSGRFGEMQAARFAPGCFILCSPLSLYTSTCVHPARSHSSRARYCSTLGSCKG